MSDPETTTTKGTSMDGFRIERDALLTDLADLVRELGPNADLVTDRLRNVILHAVANGAPVLCGAEKRRALFTDYCDVRERLADIDGDADEWRKYGTHPDEVQDVTEKDVVFHEKALLSPAPRRPRHRRGASSAA